MPRRPGVTATKGTLGHTLGATGIEAALTALTIQHRRRGSTAGARADRSTFRLRFAR
ncbi:hypothetical protein [Streptomyces sp. NPDC055287]